MDSHATGKIIDNIKVLAGSADRLVILVSNPIDPDCVGTGLAFAWWLAAQNKNAEVVSLFPIPREMTAFPGIQQVLAAEPAGFDLSGYQAAVLIDGCDWEQFFGRDRQQLMRRLDLRTTANIDHHIPGDIQRDIPDRCLCVTTSSTAQLFFDTFIKPAGMQIPPPVADWLYRALLYDSRTFRNEIHPGEYQFAESLIAAGAHHAEAVDVNFDMQDVKFMAWAIEHTEFIPDCHVSLLILDARTGEELNRTFGADWRDLDRLYKEVVLRQIKGYHYGIILVDNRDGTVRLSWRTRSYGSHCSIADVAREAGFRAGGHRNAGGGTFSGALHEARSSLLTALRRALEAAAP